MAFTEHMGDGGHVYRRCRVIRRPDTDRLLACNADVFHSIGVAHGPDIENCEFSYAADDLINIQGFLSLVFRQPSAGSVDVLTQVAADMPVGTRVRFFDFATLQSRGKATVTESALLDDDDAQAAQEMVKEKKLNFLKPARLLHLTLDHEVPLEKYTLMVDDARVARGAVIRGSYLHDCFARGIVFKGDQGLIENNRFENLGIASIGLSIDPIFMEGPFNSAITIRGNQITRNGWNDLVSRGDWNYMIGAISVTSERGQGLAEAPTNFDIHVVDNTITDSANCGILMTNVSGGEITGNILVNPVAKEPLDMGKRMGLEDPDYGIVVAASQDIKVEGNKIDPEGAFCKGPIRYYPPVTNVGPQQPAAAP